jgi:hypothetical protein
MRNRFWSRSIAPSTFNSSASGFFDPLYGAIEAHEMTRMSPIFARAAINSSVIPSADAVPDRGTRNANGPLGGPGLTAQSTRNFNVLASSCGLPGNAQAYSLNFAAVPKGSLGYLTAWPAGQPQPLVASLNDVTGTIAANAVIVPAGAHGAVSVFASDATDLVIDINGYFAPPRHLAP